LPLGWLSYREYQRQDAAAVAAASAGVTAAPPAETDLPSAPAPSAEDADSERPARLN